MPAGRGPWEWLPAHTRLGAAHPQPSPRRGSGAPPLSSRERKSLGRSLALCGTSDFPPSAPTRVRVPATPGLARHVFSMKTRASPTAGRPGLPSPLPCSDCWSPAPTWPGVPWAEGVSGALRAESEAGPRGDASRSSLMPPCCLRCLQAVPRSGPARGWRPGHVTARPRVFTLGPLRECPLTRAQR